MRLSLLLAVLIAGAGIFGCGTEHPTASSEPDRVPVSTLPDGKDGTLYSGNLLEAEERLLQRLKHAGLVIRRAWTPDWETSRCAYFALVPFMLVELPAPDSRMHEFDFWSVERPSGECVPFWIAHPV